MVLFPVVPCTLICLVPLNWTNHVPLDTILQHNSFSLSENVTAILLFTSFHSDNTSLQEAQKPLQVLLSVASQQPFGGEQFVLAAIKERERSSANTALC